MTATKRRVHTAALLNGKPRTGDTVTIAQGGGARRFIPEQGWVVTARANFLRFGACSRSAVTEVRAPLPEEYP